MTLIRKALPLVLLLPLVGHGEPTIPSNGQATASPAPVVAPAPAPVAPRPAPASAPRPVVAAPVAAPAAVVAETAPPVLTAEQRRQQELLANAERIDQANRELLAKNQELQLQLENVGIQLKVLQNDRSSQDFRNGAIAIVVGFLLGWFFAGTRQKKSSW